jgi:hypothetical protein
MKALALVVTIALSLMVSGCVTAEQQTANAGWTTNVNVNHNSKPVAKVTAKPPTPIRTHFIEI